MKQRMKFILALLVLASSFSMAQELSLEFDSDKKLVKYQQAQLENVSSIKLTLKDNTEDGELLISCLDADGKAKATKPIPYSVKTKKVWEFPAFAIWLKDNCKDCEQVKIEFKDSKINFEDEKKEKATVISIILKKADSNNSDYIKLTIPIGQTRFTPDLTTRAAVSPCKELCSDKLPDYKVVLDYSTKDYGYAYYKRIEGGTECEYKRVYKKALPRGKTIGLTLINAENTFDSVAVSTAFENGNLEDRTAFEKNVTAAGKTADANNGKPEENADGAANPQNSVEESVPYTNDPYVKKLREELSRYNIEKSRCLPDRAVWSNDVLVINNNIKIYLQIDFSTADELKTGLMNLTKNAALITDVLSEYSLAITYGVTSTTPVQIKDFDTFTYNLDFYNKGKKLDPRSYSFLIKGGFKIDFSTGLGYSSLGNEVYQIISSGSRQDTSYYRDEYFITTDSITAITTVEQKKIQKVEDELNIGLLTLAHFYFRSGTYVNISATLGFLLNTQGNLNYLAGGSVILGQKQRLVLSVGASFGKYNKLNPKYNTNDIYDNDVLNNVSDVQLVTDIWNVGWFVGATWNLGSVTTAKGNKE